MGTFQFWLLSDEERQQLRANQQRCVALLQAGKPLATKLAAAGVHVPLTELEEQVLQGFHLVQQAHQGYTFEVVFDELCRRAGFVPSDAGLLASRVEALFREREPVRYQAEVILLTQQWFRADNGEERFRS